MRWEADVKIAGPVGAMGQRVLQPIVNQQVGNVLDALDKQVAAAPRGAKPTSAELRPRAGAESEPNRGHERRRRGDQPALPRDVLRDPEGPTHSTEDSRVASRSASGSCS